MPKEIIYLAQTTLESKSHRPLPIYQFLLKTFSYVRKLEKSQFFLGYTVQPYLHIFEGENNDLLKK